MHLNLLEILVSHVLKQHPDGYSQNMDTVPFCDVELALQFRDAIKF